MRVAASSSLCAWMTVALVLSGCDERGSRPPASPAPITPGAAPSPSAQTHTLSGRVVEGTTQGARPVADVPILITIFPPPGVFPRPSGFRSVVSDSAGRYVIGEVPHQHSVVLKAASPYTLGSLQPCAAALTLGADAVLDVELLSSPTTRRTIQGSPTISGVVYETTAEGRRPIADAAVGYEAVCWTGEFPNAWTRTDANGRYELCRLPSVDIVADGCIVAFAAGRSSASGPLNPRGDMTVDIDLPRLPFPGSSPLR